MADPIRREPRIYPATAPNQAFRPSPGTAVCLSARGEHVALMRYDANKQSIVVAYLLWLFAGAAGGHRFYLRRFASGAFMLSLFVVSFSLPIVFVGYLGLMVVGLWALVDAVLIPGMVRDHNNRLIASL